MKNLAKEMLFVQALDSTFPGDPFDKQYVNELIEGGVTVIHETVPDIYDDFQGIIKRIYEFRRMCTALGVLVVDKPSDIERAKQKRQLATIFGLQHLPFMTSVYPDDLAFIEMLHKLGVKILQLTYQKRNLVGDGCGERTNSGLSKFGIKVIEEMNRLGMLVDLSHVGDKSTMEAIEISQDPVVFSHANCRALVDNVRNKDDEQIVALAEKGGVIGICAFPPLLNMKRPPTFDDFLNHVTHVINLVGIDHVGIGLDYSFGAYSPKDIPLPPQKWLDDNPELLAPWQTFAPGQPYYYVEEFKQPSKWKINIINGLDNRGYSSTEIEKILGKNFLRVFNRVWRD